MVRHAAWLTLVALVGCKSDFDLDHNNDDVRNPDDDTDPVGVDGPQPDILVTPEALSFGTKLPDCPTDPLVVTVQNVGDLDLEIYDIALSGNGASAYTLTGVPRTLMPAESMDLAIVFEAAGTVEYPAEIEIRSNDPDTPTERVGLEGEGGLNATNEDLFFQDEPSAVDVLWVLDNSCSMSDKVAALEAEFDTFISSFTTLGLDYQIAVTTTDMDDPTHQGRLQGMGVISPATAAAAGLTVEQAFDEAVEPTSSGSGDERALSAAHAALESPGYAVSAGLVRPGANLAVIVVGDEDDGSSWTVSNFSAWMDQYQGDATKTVVSGIIQQSTSLFDVNCAGMGSPKLEGVIDATGGIRTGICDLDFDQVLRWLSYSAAGLRAEFPLTDTPLNGAAGMQVRVNGQTVSSDPIRVNGWWYVRTTNSVVFYGASIPGPGAEVRITYPVAGTCN